MNGVIGNAYYSYRKRSLGHALNVAYAFGVRRIYG